MKNLSPIRPTQAVDFVHIDCIVKIAENCLQKFNEIVKSDPTLKIMSFQEFQKRINLKRDELILFSKIHTKGTV